MSSSRLPGKVLLPIAGKPMLQRVWERVAQARLVENSIVATTNDPSDDPLAVFCRQQGYAVFRGNLFDVLDRYYQAAIWCKAEIVVRITADCPMIDPKGIDAVIQKFLDDQADFAANRLPPPFKRTTPIGMDTEVCSFASLEQAWKHASKGFEREHVMPYLYDTPGRFKVSLVDLAEDLSQLRFTVDTAADLQVANEIYTAFAGREDFNLEELLALNSLHPLWQQQVAGIQPKPLFETDSRAQFIGSNQEGNPNG